MSGPEGEGIPALASFTQPGHLVRRRASGRFDGTEVFRVVGRRVRVNGARRWEDTILECVTPGARVPAGERHGVGPDAPLTIVGLEGCEPAPCQWFALCENPATHLEPHPAFPDGVPTCDRCGELAR